MVFEEDVFVGVDSSPCVEDDDDVFVGFGDSPAFEDEVVDDSFEAVYDEAFGPPPLMPCGRRCVSRVGSPLGYKNNDLDDLMNGLE